MRTIPNIDDMVEIIKLRTCARSFYCSLTLRCPMYLPAEQWRLVGTGTGITGACVYEKLRVKSRDYQYVVNANSSPLGWDMAYETVKRLAHKRVLCTTTR